MAKHWGFLTVGVVPQVIFHEGLDEEIAMVVALVAAEFEGVARFGASGFEQFRVKLVGEEFVGEALVDEDRGTMFPI